MVKILAVPHGGCASRHSLHGSDQGKSMMTRRYGVCMPNAINDFLDGTLALLLKDRSPDHRDVFIRQIPKATHKSMGVVAFTAPEVIDMQTVELESNRDYIEKCFTTAYGSLASPDYTAGIDRNSKRLFHSFVIGSQFASVLSVTAIAEAGPGRWVVMFTSTGTPEGLAKKTLFNDVESRLGKGWEVSKTLSVIERDSLYPFFEDHYGPADVRPDTLGYLSLRAAATGTRMEAR